MKFCKIENLSKAVNQNMLFINKKSLSIREEPHHLETFNPKLNFSQNWNICGYFYIQYLFSQACILLSLIKY